MYVNRPMKSEHKGMGWRLSQTYRFPSFSYITSLKNFNDLIYHLIYRFDLTI